MLKVKHVLLDEGLLYLLISPVDKESVVEVGFFRQSPTEVYRVPEVGASPIGLQEYAEFLSPAQSKHRY